MLNAHLNSAILVLCLINFGYIALLPRKFFRKGAQLNLQWWLTAAPLFLCPALLGVSYFGYLEPFLGVESPWTTVLGMIAVIVSTLSILLMGFAIGTHRVPIYMFHDKHDAGQPKHLVTWGPYRYIRHPIYASYLYALWASFLFTTNWATLLCLIYGIVVLTVTSNKEEQKLSEPDAFGDEYKEYMKTTGQFFPPLSAISLTHNNTDAVVEKIAAEQRVPQPTEHK